jgi:hypothetical protein
MHVSISADKALHDLTLEFVKVIAGPKIESFRMQSFGPAISTVSVILELQNPEATLKHHTRFFPEQQWIYCHAVLDAELDSEQPRRAIAETVQMVLAKAFRKAKGADFDSSAFLNELDEYLATRIAGSASHGRVA